MFDNHASRSMCSRDAESIIKNGGGRANTNNSYYISHIEQLCERIEGWNISKFIDLDAQTPQIPTAIIPPPAVLENYKNQIAVTAILEMDSPPITAVVPVLEMDSPSITAVVPLPMIETSRTNLCKLETCNNDRNGNTYCSTNCRVIYNNINGPKRPKGA